MSFAKQTNHKIDSLIKVSQLNTSDSIFSLTCWHIAKEYDEQNKFDSMQYWLNIGAERLSVSDTTLLHFHYSAFQSIAYYYNGLLQLDLYESIKVLDIAVKLNDSILLSTGYNYVGLAYFNIGEYHKAIPYFYKGMPFAKQPPFDSKYLVASKPHHLHGNLAETYYKLNLYDSALVNAKKSLSFASQITSKRGMAVANNLLGLIYFKLGLLDSAYIYQNNAYQLGLLAKENDVSLISCAALANIKMAQSKTAEAVSFLKKGLKLKEEDPTINFYFTKQFLEDALSTYYKLQNQSGIQKCLELLNENNSRISRMTDQQVERIIKAGISNETRANELSILELQQRKKISNYSIGFLLSALAASLLLLLFVILNNRRRSREIKERQTISRDLHDDINSTLSSIKLYSELSVQEQLKKSQNALQITHRITEISAELMSRVSDIIFILKHNEENYLKLEEKIKSFATETLKAREIIAKFNIQSDALKAIKGAENVRNLLLIIKEAVNNVAKYSDASLCNINLHIKTGILYLEVIDNGNGIVSNYKPGNGLLNMKHRCEEMKGTFTYFNNKPNGCYIQCSFKLSNIR